MPVLVTGSSSGIGLSLALLYLKQGARVIGLDKATGELTKHPEFDELLIDFSDTMATEKIISFIKILTLAPFEIAFFNAGVNSTGPFSKQLLETQMSLVDINLVSPVILSAELIKNKMISKGGSIVFTSSLSQFTSYPGASSYAGSKAGLSSWASSLRVALKPENINVLLVYPGPTDTPHASLHSPDNSKSSGRMSPAILASKIDKAVNTRKRQLIPGIGNKIIAATGQYFPIITDRLMEKLLFNKM